MKTELTDKFNLAMDKLMTVLSSLSEEQLNKVPFDGSWTAGQVGNHLSKSYNIMGVLSGNVADTERDPAMKLAEVEKVFRNYDIKMKAPVAVEPTTEVIGKARLLDTLKDRIYQQYAFIQKKDLSKTCLDYEIPGYGPFTRYEWLGFNTLHTERHLHQLENIVKHL